MEQKGRNFVPLVNCKPDEPFQLELRYTVPGNGSRLVYPDFPDPAPAVQEVDLAVYLPQEWVLLGKNGPWTDQFGATWWEQLGLVNDNKASPQIDPRPASGNSSRPSNRRAWTIFRSMADSTSSLRFNLPGRRMGPSR